MKAGTIIHNFTLKNIRRIPELDCRLWELEYAKTGTRLCWLDREDENKSFAIAFKTIPEDSTGVFHILEHSVLCGSDKYPVKEPFVELLKTSVQTFLNAMTYPDKTVYPVSSRNDRDFLNLIDVYMDGVLHPAIYHKPEIFRQEGWRHEFRDDGKLMYQGVVLNEMKGAFASADAVLAAAMASLLFPDNCYRFVSGGRPECIPDLTYEQFLAIHKRYYHPSNAGIFLCGKVKLEEVLSHIDSYLKEYERKEENVFIPVQKPIPFKEEKVDYEIGAGENGKSRSVISQGQVLCSHSEQEKLYAGVILKDYLAGDNDAPLKQAILSAGLGQDVKINIHDGILQPWISWEVWNTEEDNAGRIRDTVNEVLSDLADNGLDQGRLEACFNHLAFQLRDRDGGMASRSLSEILTMLDSWNYDEDPAQYLQIEETLGKIESKLKSGYFSGLIRSIFLENIHKAAVVLVPSQSEGKEKQAREAARIELEYNKWSETERKKHMEENALLSLWQQTSDTAEALASIPVLKLEDIDALPPKLPVSVTKRSGVTVLVHDTCNGIVYMNLHFDVSDLHRQELPIAALLAKLIGKLPTAKHSSAELQMLIKQRIGALDFKSTVYPGKSLTDYRIRLSAEMACLQSQFDSAAGLVCEILTQTIFSDRLHLKNMLSQICMQMQIELVGAGHQYSAMQACSGLSSAGTVREVMGGSSFINWIKNQSAAEDAQMDLLQVQLKTVAAMAFTARRLTIGVSRNGEYISEKIISAFDEGEDIKTERISPGEAGKTGLVIPAPVGFAVKAMSYKKQGKAFCGSSYVLANILNFIYLWSEIRIRGGAYGAGFVNRDDGDMFFYTYRDPDPGHSLGIFDGASDFIRSYCAEGKDLSPIILGAMSAADPLLNTKQKIMQAENRYFKEISHEDVCRIRQELISATSRDLLVFAELLDAALESSAVCVTAGADILENCKSRITEIRQIL